MKSLLLIVIVSGIHEVTGKDPYCMTNDCPCCVRENCNDEQICTDGCVDGYYGKKCYNQCPEYCTRCAREFGVSSQRDYKICYLCAGGYYNGTGVTDCSTPCPLNCLNNKCDKTTGHCLDDCTDDSLTGDKCDRCARGYYGANCVPCPEYCKDDVCDVGNGRCTNGCKRFRFTGTKCDQCQLGKYGDNCDKACSDNCLNGVCDRTEETCTSGCTGNFAGDKCDECKPTYYGKNCDIMCRNCLHGQCDRNSGICDDCTSGKYGQYCDMSCSDGCKNDVCYRDNATCIHSCKQLYSGDTCCVNNNNCELCDTVTTCSKCKSGFYGQSCGQMCPGNCAGSCNKLSGDCTVCKTGYHGNKCTEICPNQCFDSKCSQQSGKCTACNSGYHGNTCNLTCSDTCVNKMCYQDGGKCVDCMAGYHGVSCDLHCATYCINGTCIQETGTCMYGCEEDFTDKCAQNNIVVHDNVGAILGGVVGGLCVVIIILVGYIVLSRCRSRGTEQNIEPEPSNDVELEEQHDYEKVDGELRNEKTVYSDLQSDG